MYMSAGQGSPGSCPSTAAWLDPDSNHTSTMSISLRNFVDPHLAHLKPAGRICSGAYLYQASALSRAKRSTTNLCTEASPTNSLQSSHWNIAIGTPQTRCREMHQSGRPATMFEMRSSPHDGSHFTFLISSSARVRSVPPPGSFPSIEMNHCSVARKMMGL